MCGAGAGWKCVGAGRERAKFSNSCGRGADLNFAGVGRERTKNFNLRRALVYTEPFNVALF